MPKVKRALIILAILATQVGMDQFTKELAIVHIQGRPMTTYLGDTFRFEYAENAGAFLSMGAGMSRDYRFWALTVLVGVVLAGFFVFTVVRADLGRIRTVALSLVVAGGFSNLLDRMFRPGGRVIDFMNMGIGSLRTGIFNYADVIIMVGMGIYLLSIWLEPETPVPAGGSVQ